MRKTDILDKLRQIQARRLVAEFCRASGKTRAWFYKALAGEASLLDARAHIDVVLKPTAKHPVTAARVELGLSQSELGRRLGLSRMSVYQWEHDEPDHPATLERVSRIQGLKSPAMETKDPS